MCQNRSLFGVGVFTLLYAVVLTGCLNFEPSASSELDGSSYGAVAISPVSGIIQRSVQGQVSALDHTTTTGLANVGKCPTLGSARNSINCLVDSSGKSMTLFYSNCRFEDGASYWNGSEILTSNSGLSCDSAPLSWVGDTITRTFGQSTTKRATNSGQVVNLESKNPSGYKKLVSGGMRTTYGSVGASTVEISGIHIFAIVQSKSVWDYSINTEDNQPLTINNVMGQWVVNGTIVIQDNLKQTFGRTSFSNVTYSATSGCCHPVSGKMTTQLSGNKSGLETLTMEGTSCGAAKMTDVNGTESSVFLQYCF